MTAVPTMNPSTGAATVVLGRIVIDASAIGDVAAAGGGLQECETTSLTFSQLCEFTVPDELQQDYAALQSSIQAYVGTNGANPGAAKLQQSLSALADAESVVVGALEQGNAGDVRLGSDSLFQAASSVSAAAHALQSGLG